jgi:hypothetical protein
MKLRMDEVKKVRTEGRDGSPMVDIPCTSFGGGVKRTRRGRPKEEKKNL